MIHIKNKEQRKLLIRHYLFGLDDCKSMSASIWSKLFQRDIALDYMDCVPDEQSYGEDLVFLYFCLKKATKIRVVDRAYYHYVTRENSLSHCSDSEYCLNEVTLWNCLIKKMDKADADPEEISAWLIQRMACVIEMVRKIDVPRHYWGEIDDICEKKVAIYGAGKVGRDYCCQMLEKGVQIVGVFDRKYEDRHICGFDVMAPYTMKNVIFDVAIIAINSFEQAQVIRDDLIRLGIDGTAIIWNKPNRFF